MNKILRIFDRIDISSIFSQHLTTLYHYEKRQFYNKTEIPFSDKFIFLVIPILLSILFCFAGLKFNKDYVNITLTCLSIFAGLLFGLLTMVFSMVQENQKLNPEKEKDESKKKIILAKIDLTKHLFINISFSIVLSLLALIFVLFTQFYPVQIVEMIDTWKYYIYLKKSYLYALNGLSFFFIIEFMLTLMMILRRFTVLFLNQIFTEIK